MFSSSAYLGVLLALLPLPSKLYASGQHGIMLELVPSVLSPRITVFSVFLVFLEPERDFQLMLRFYCVSLYLISVRLLYGRLIMNSSWISYPHFWHDDLVLVSSTDIERGIDMQRPLVLWGMCWWWWVPIWLGSWSGQKGSSSFSANCSEHYKVSQFVINWVSVYLGDIQIGLYRSQVPHRGSGLPFCWRADHVWVSVRTLLG